MTGGPPASPSTGGVFISYRREDAAYPAGWLFDRLADRLGVDRVFKDVDSIELGDDFVAEITAAVASCAVLLAVIGDRWLDAKDEHGRRRLDDPQDFVRLEIEAALTRDIRVIPVLVGGARVPQLSQLPPTLAKLAHRQALELSPARFGGDVGRLLSMLDKLLAATIAPIADSLPNAVGLPASSSSADQPRAIDEQTEPHMAERAYDPTRGNVPSPAPAPRAGQAVPYATPLVQSLAEQHGVDLTSIKGTGVGGRIRKQDVLEAADAIKNSSSSTSQSGAAHSATNTARPQRPKPRFPGVLVKMPTIGEYVTEGTVTRWLKKEGESVVAGEPLLEASSDLLDREIPSPVSGIVREIVVAEGQSVRIGTVLAVIEEAVDVSAPVG